MTIAPIIKTPAGNGTDPGTGGVPHAVVQDALAAEAEQASGHQDELAQKQLATL